MSFSEIQPGADAARGAVRFATTQWHVVTAAGRPDCPRHEEALATLCRAYWLPVYAYIRRRGNRPEDAQDLTQEFFARLLAKQWLDGIEPNTGRFRSFLLTAVVRFLANEYDRGRTLKRGGGMAWVSMDEAEEQCRESIERGDTPEAAYDRRWALAMLHQALKGLREEMAVRSKGRHFDRLSPFLSREPGPTEYRQLGHELGISPGAIGVAVHRLRQRYREQVYREVARTLSDPALVDEEVRHLFAALHGEGRCSFSA